MGGYGSSRWETTVTRMTTEGLPRLDLRALTRAGGLVPGTSTTITWHSSDSVWASITTQVHTDEPDTLILEYSTLASTGSWMPTRERIALETTSCQYGGERSWLMCPECSSRRAVLYAVHGKFRCRPCHRLAYASTRDPRGGRPAGRSEPWDPG